ncbi:MAG: hypothetical protein HOP28_18150 [Gemmatimonadales bacterium]|nr:hypothetical protein [Gemmatimonadales bacterium]
MNGPPMFALMIPILGILVGGLAIFVKSHIGHALAERIAGGGQGSAVLQEEVQTLRLEVESLRADLIETQERLDFTERLIAAGKKEG